MVRLTKCEKRKGLKKKLERCVLEVKKKGKNVNPWAVCRAAVSSKICPIKIKKRKK